MSQLKGRNKRNLISYAEWNDIFALQMQTKHQIVSFCLRLHWICWIIWRVCAKMCVCATLYLMIFDLKMVCDIWRPRGTTLNHIGCLSRKFASFFFPFHMTKHFSPEAAFTFLLFSYFRVSFSPCIDLLWMADARGNGEWEWQSCSFSLSLRVWSHYLFFRGGCCSEAASCSGLPAVSNRDRECDTD